MTDRNTSKQRRAAQNKANREALATRTTKAAQPSRTAGRREDADAVPTRSRGRVTTPPSRNGRPARTAAARPVRQPRPPTNPITRFIAEVQARPGGKAVFFSFMFSLVSAVMLMTFKITPASVMEWPAKLTSAYWTKNHITPPKGYPKKSVTVNMYATALLGPIVVIFAVAPVIITTATMLLSRRGNARRNVTTGTICMLIVFFFAGPMSLFLIITTGGLVFAMFQVRKADPPTPRRARGQAADADADADADEQDEDEDDEGQDYEDDEDVEDDDVDADEVAEAPAKPSAGRRKGADDSAYFTADGED